MKTLVRGRVLTFHADPADSADNHDYHENGAILIDAGRIVAVGDHADVAARADAAGAALIDHRPHIVMPGFIDPHIHFPQVQVIASWGEQLLDWLNTYTFPAELRLDGLKVVLDCANGAAYRAAPDVLWELGAEVIPIGVSPDGFNINDGVGSTHPEAAAARVVETGADLGIALDGDADRLQVVDSAGRLYNGDELLYVLVKDRMATDGKVEGAVGTLMTNMAVEVALQESGVKFVRAAVGDRYVVDAGVLY